MASYEAIRAEAHEYTRTRNAEWQQAQEAKTAAEIRQTQELQERTQEAISRNQRFLDDLGIPEVLQAVADDVLKEGKVEPFAEKNLLAPDSRIKAGYRLTSDPVTLLKEEHLDKSSWWIILDPHSWGLSVYAHIDLDQETPTRVSVKADDIYRYRKPTQTPLREQVRENGLEALRRIFQYSSTSASPRDVPTDRQHLASAVKVDVVNLVDRFQPDSIGRTRDYTQHLLAQLPEPGLSRSGKSAIFSQSLREHFGDDLPPVKFLGFTLPGIRRG